jgi:predicted TIM-barrel fold metal-dependent hydrolase
MKNRRDFVLGMVSTVSLAALSDQLISEVSPPKKGAIDSHAHVFLRLLAMSQRHRYIPNYDATVSQYLSLLDSHHMTNGVLVQPSFLGTDNSFLLATLRKYPERLRGIAVIDPASDMEKLKDMHSAGIVGVRLNLIGLPTPDLTTPDWQTAFANLRKLNWIVEVQVEAGRLEPVIKPLLEHALRVVVDHFGRPDPVQGVEDPGFLNLLRAAKSQNLFVKISGAYRDSNDNIGEVFALEALPLLRSAFGLRRIVWGSDWPHTQFEKVVTYESAYELLFKMLPQEKDRSIVLWDSPADLFGFRKGAILQKRG